MPHTNSHQNAPGSRARIQHFTRSPIFAPSRALSVRVSTTTQLYSSFLLLDLSMPNIPPTAPRRIQHSRNRSVRSYAELAPRFPSTSLGCLGIGLLHQRAGVRDLLGSRSRSKEKEMSQRSGRYNSRDTRAKRPSERNEWVTRSRRMRNRPILRSGWLAQRPGGKR